MWRRLKEDRNQHYDDLDCGCWTDPREMARFKEQPKDCRKICCTNPRHSRFVKGAAACLTLQERRALQS
jgi:hypothetical protein